MPFFLVFVGILLIVAGIKNNHVALGNQLSSDFTGEKSFAVWLVAFGVIGAVGYIPKIRGLSNAFMALVLIVMVLVNGKRGDFLTQLREGVTHPVKSVGNAGDAAATGSAKLASPLVDVSSSTPGTVTSATAGNPSATGEKLLEGAGALVAEYGMYLLLL